MLDVSELSSWFIQLWKRLAALLSRPTFPPPTDLVLLKHARGWFGEQLMNHPHLSAERRGEYARAAVTLFERMTPTALLRWRANTQDIRFYASLEEMTVELAKTYPKVQHLLAQGIVVGGAYARTLKQLHLNGGDEESESRDITARYAHEFSHAVNGSQREISNSKVWEEAWKTEIVAQNLSLLALQDCHEGFAEFGKALYTAYGSLVFTGGLGNPRTTFSYKSDGRSQSSRRRFCTSVNGDKSAWT